MPRRLRSDTCQKSFSHTQPVEKGHDTHSISSSPRVRRACDCCRHRPCARARACLVAWRRIHRVTARGCRPASGALRTVLLPTAGLLRPSALSTRLLSATGGPGCAAAIACPAADAGGPAVWHHVLRRRLHLCRGAADTGWQRLFLPGHRRTVLRFSPVSYSGRCRAPFRRGPRQRSQKFFASFFQKRRPSLLHLTAKDIGEIPAFPSRRICQASINWSTVAAVSSIDRRVTSITGQPRRVHSRRAQSSSLRTASRST